MFGSQRHQTEKGHKPRPTHFPITPFLQPPPVPSLPRQYLVDNRSLRATTTSMETNASNRRQDRSGHRQDRSNHRQELPASSIYDAFARNSLTAPRSDPPPPARDRATGLLSPIPVDRPRFPSRASSIDNFSNPPSIYSPSSTSTDLTETLDAQLRQSVLSSDGGYESSSTVGRAGRRTRSNVREQMRHVEVLQEHADEDKASARISIGSKIKADKILGLAAPTACMASAYICSGLGVVSTSTHFIEDDTDLSSPKLGHLPTRMPSEASSSLPTRWDHSGDPKSYTMPFREMP
jgi:Arc/MetJ-type ribon-helix-helix transcriptional regulator